jgi:V/A-type H+-transporting ATPase subunit I
MQASLAAAASAVQLELVSSDREQHYMFLISHKSETEAAVEALRPYGFSITQFKDLTGTAKENIESMDREIARITAEREEHASSIAGMGESHQALNICIDRLTQEIAKQTARESFLTNDTIVFLEGWATVPELPKLESTLNAFACAYEFSDPEPEDIVPTKLKNSRLVTPLNMVTEMYSLPAYNGIDPNPLIFPFFTIYFGMMYCDIAYGIVLIVLSLLISKKFKPKGTLGYMMGLATMCGVTTLFFGILTGSLCGDAVPVITEKLIHIDRVELWSVINPLSNPMGVLYIAIIMGAIQIMFGMCLKVYLCIRDGRPLDALFDVGSWWLVFAGIAVVATGHGPWVVLAGALALILTQGRSKEGIVGKIFGGIASLYDITSYLSDILSYTRLMALMLATSVIASVVNLLGALPGSIIVFIPIFLFGHAFNMGINIIGTYVHAARLQYLEFFSKFYISGGVPFRPLAYNTKYVDIIEEEK